MVTFRKDIHVFDSEYGANHGFGHPQKQATFSMHVDINIMDQSPSSKTENLELGTGFVESAGPQYAGGDYLGL